jgi:hypothetical protein
MTVNGDDVGNLAGWCRPSEHPESGVPARVLLARLSTPISLEQFRDEALAHEARGRRYNDLLRFTRTLQR